MSPSTANTLPLMLLIRINKINWLQLYENSVMVKNQRTSPASPPVVCSDRAKGEPAGPGRLGKYDRRGGERIVSLTGNHMSSWAFLLRKPFEEKWVIMHKIAFQADNHLVTWRLRSLLLFFSCSWPRVPVIVHALRDLALSAVTHLCRPLEPDPFRQGCSGWYRVIAHRKHRNYGKRSGNRL